MSDESFNKTAENDSRRLNVVKKSMKKQRPHLPVYNSHCDRLQQDYLKIHIGHCDRDIIDYKCGI